MQTEDGGNFTGTVTMAEAKHGIYRDCLGFVDFKIFELIQTTVNKLTI